MGREMTTGHVGDKVLRATRMVRVDRVLAEAGPGIGCWVLGGGVGSRLGAEKDQGRALSW